MTARVPVLLLAAALAGPALAGDAAPEPRFWIAAQASGAAGVQTAAGGAFGPRVNLFAGRLALGASFDGGLGFLHGVGAWDMTLLAGAGPAFPIGSGWSAYALGMGGTHFFEVEEEGGPGYQEHLFPALAFRVGAQRATGRRLFFLTYGVAFTMIFDVGRQDDAFLGHRAGGVTALLSVSIGIGLRARGRTPPAE